MVMTRAPFAIGVVVGSHITIIIGCAEKEVQKVVPSGWMDGERKKCDSEQLISLVREHKYLMDICNELGDIFKGALLVNYALSSILIGCFGFLISNEPSIPVEERFLNQQMIS